jgi:ribosomal protein S18 acetylase RimI-like enzyme
MRAHDTAASGGSDWTRVDLEECCDELDVAGDAWVAELDGRIVGYVDFEVRSGGRLIVDGYVDPQARGRGVGAPLAAAVEGIDVRPYRPGEERAVHPAVEEAWSVGAWGGVQTLGVRPAWRRRGIGEALLRAAFAEVFRRGERTVALQVDAQSPTGANRLYERAGMRVLYEIVVWQKALSAG